MDLLNRIWLHLSTQSPSAIVITVFLLFVIFILWYETLTERLDWRDLITSPSTNRVSLTKVLQLVGGVVGTWIMVFVTLHDKMSNDLFFTYLAYVGAIEGWSKFVTAKYGSEKAYSRSGYGQYGRYGQGNDTNINTPYYRQSLNDTPPPITPKPPIGDDV